MGATAAVDIRAEKFFRNATNTTCDTAAPNDITPVAALGCHSGGNSARGPGASTNYAKRFIRDHSNPECDEQRLERQVAGIRSHQCTAEPPSTAQNGDS
jgi:hypothetical protein